MISTLYSGDASLASTVARAGVLLGDTQASQTAFISAKFAMSVIQILAERSLVLLVPAVARKPSICDRMLLVCSAVLLPLDYRQRCRRDTRYRRESPPCSYAVRSRDVRSSLLFLSKVIFHRHSIDGPSRFWVC